MTTIPTNYYEGTSANERFIVPDLTPVIVAGMGGDDYIEATDTGDLLYGNLGNDVIVAKEGDDTIYGDNAPGDDSGGGDDQILAGAGNDTVFGGAGFDFINAQEGNDFVSGDSGDDYVVGGLGSDTLIGGDGNDFLFGNGVPPDGPFPLLEVISVDFDGITGLPITPEDQGGNMGAMPIIDDNATDIAYGGSGKDVAYGFGGDDGLYGGNGRDVLVGGLDFDVLTGGKGKDQFVFAEFGKSNADFITDFHKGDKIDLVASVFRHLGKSGDTLLDKYFHIGHGAHNKNDRIIFNEDKSKVIYDRDGSGHHYAPKVFAFVDPGTHLHASDFDLI